MTVSRMWHDLTNQKRAGLGHDTEQHLGSGDLAIFCPACPQPGLNLPDGWAKVYERAVHGLFQVGTFLMLRIQVTLWPCGMLLMVTLLLNT